MNGILKDSVIKLLYVQNCDWCVDVYDIRICHVTT